MEARLRVLVGIGTVFFLAIIARLLQFQIVLGARYYRLAEMNRIRRVTISAPRGKIFDRNGKELATTQPAFSLSVIPAETDSLTIAKLKLLLKDILPESSLVWSRIERNRSSSYPLRIFRNISQKLVSRIEENSNDLSGVEISVEPLRYYPFADTCSHILGYINEITEEELKRDSSYNPGNCIGRTGIEAQYEQYLRGKDGIEYIEVDSRGRRVGILSEKKPIPAEPGGDIYLTIDADLQRYAYQLLADYPRAAVVGIDLSDGGVLVLISKPGFDPNQLLGVMSETEWQTLIRDPNRPFFNRAIMGTYPPGSTFKPCVALAGLEKGLLTPNSYFTCTGKFPFGNRIFRCWSTHGRLNLIDAITHSCNSYFYQAGLRLGLDPITTTALECGFGVPTGIDIPGEKKGLIPTRSYLEARYGKRRIPSGILLNLAIGQGEVLVTPLQLACFYARIAGDGQFFKPHLLMKTGNTNLKLEIQNSKLTTVFALLKDALFYAVERGTGAGAKVASITIAGKTGTAQNPFGEDHAWFVGYAGTQKPEVLFCILVENAGKGGAICAPIAQKLFRYYFKIQPGTSSQLVSSNQQE